MQQMSLFDMLGAEYDDYKTKESNDWYWHFKDYPPTNNLKVFSCFACGGGSSMGYKLAGYDVIGCLEIDKRMNSIYTKNHNPKFFIFIFHFHHETRNMTSSNDIT